MGDENKLISVLETLAQIEEDLTVPKNIRFHIKSAITALEEKEAQTAVKIDKALEALNEIDSDPNIPQYTRTQIWNIVSVLECK